MGKPNQSTLAPHFLLFAPTSSPHNTPFPPISSHFPLFSPHFPPFPPISPNFSWYWVHYGYVAGYIATHLVRVFLRPASVSVSVSVGGKGRNSWHPGIEAVEEKQESVVVVMG